MFNFTSSSKASSSPIMSLPNEILSEIALYVPARHSLFGYAVEAKNIAALSATSRRMRDVSLSFLFRDVVITNESQLVALSKLNEDLLNLIRELNIFMDGDFYAVFKASAFQYTASRSVFLSLGKVLTRTPSISALRIRVAQSIGADSAWSRTNLLRIDGIPVANALEHSLPPSLKLNSLRAIELDGFSGIAPLLRVAPELETLCVCQPSGFAQYTNAEFVEALAFVPQLKKLQYTPESLRVTSTLREVQAAMAVDNEEEADMDIESHEVDYSAEFLREIGKALPTLENLSLQVRWHGEEILFPASEASVTPQALIDAAKHLPNLKNLALPTSVFAAKHYAILRSTPLNTEIDMSREAILSNIPMSERSAALELGLSCQKIESISFIRPISSTDKYDSCITYSINVTPEHIIHLGPNAAPIIRPTRVEVASAPLTVDASHGQVDALPQLKNAQGFGFSWDGLKKSVSEMSRHPMAPVVAAVGGGIVLSETGRILYSHAVSVSV